MKTMKKLIMIALFSLFSTLSYADTFYNKRNGVWNVVGVVNEGELNPSCYALTTWKDGSEFRLIFDLADGELYILMINNQWNITDEPGRYNLRLNVILPNTVFGDNGVFELLNKNTIRLRGMPIKFVDIFSQGTKLQFVMPGNIPNVMVDLKGSSQAIDFLSECVNVYKSSTPKTKPKSRGLEL
jgi:hypothetical protein